MFARNRVRQATFAGFTTIEIIIVVVVLAIIASVVIPWATTSDTFRVRAGTRLVKSALDLAQTEAQRRSSDVFATFSAGSSTLQVTVFNITTGQMETVTDIDLSEDSGVDDLTIRVVVLGGGTGLVYRPDGTVLNSSYTELPAENRIVVGNNNQSSTIYINPVTGISTIK